MEILTLAQKRKKERDSVLKPMGIDISLASVLEIALQRGLGLSKQEADEVTKEESVMKIKDREEKKWNQRKSK